MLMEILLVIAATTSVLSLGMAVDQVRKDRAERERIARETPAEHHVLRAVLNVEMRLLDLYYSHKHLTYDDFLDKVVRGTIPFKG